MPRQPPLAQPPSSAADNGALRYNIGMSTQDPSALTTQQLLRENFWLRELLESRIQGIEARMDGADKAVTLLQAFADRTPTTMDVQNQVVQLREVAMEMFKGIKTQLLERDAQIDRASKEVKSAVDAAFAAAKESVGKTETTFVKQLDMLGETIKTNTKSMEDKIADIKERITIIESRTSISDPSTAITLARMDESVSRLKASGAHGAGRSEGQATLWALILAGFAALVSASMLSVMIVNLVK